MSYEQPRPPIPPALKKTGASWAGFCEKFIQDVELSFRVVKWWSDRATLESSAD